MTGHSKVDRKIGQQHPKATTQHPRKYKTRTRTTLQQPRDQTWRQRMLETTNLGHAHGRLQHDLSMTTSVTAMASTNLVSFLVAGLVCLEHGKPGIIARILCQTAQSFNHTCNRCASAWHVWRHCGLVRIAFAARWVGHQRRRQRCNRARKRRASYGKHRRRRVLALVAMLAANGCIELNNTNYIGSNVGWSDTNTADTNYDMATNPNRNINKTK